MPTHPRFRPVAESIFSCKLFGRDEVDPKLDFESAIDRGAFLARLWALFGPATSCDDGFEYVICCTLTDTVFTAYSGASGPSYGGPLGSRETLLPVLRDFEQLLALTEPVDCEISYGADSEYGGGTCLLGFRNGQSFHRTTV